MDAPSLTLRLPFPPRELAPNVAARLTMRGGRARAAKRQYAGDVAYTIREQLGPPPWPHYPGRVRITITPVYPNGRHHWDGDNLLAAIKSGIDVLTTRGLVLANLDRVAGLGLIPDDSPKHAAFAVEPPRVVPGEHHLIVVIAPIGEESQS